MAVALCLHVPAPFPLLGLVPELWLQGTEGSQEGGPVEFEVGEQGEEAGGISRGKSLLADCASGNGVKVCSAGSGGPFRGFRCGVSGSFVR